MGRSVTRPLLNILHFTTLFQKLLAKLLADFLTFGELLDDFFTLNFLQTSCTNF